MLITEQNTILTQSALVKDDVRFTNCKRQQITNEGYNQYRRYPPRAINAKQKSDYYGDEKREQ